MSKYSWTGTIRRFFCPSCGWALGRLSENLSIVCVASDLGWDSGRVVENRKGCSLRLYLCAACGQREARRVEGDRILCKCGGERALELEELEAEFAEAMARAKALKAGHEQSSEAA